MKELKERPEFRPEVEKAIKDIKENIKLLTEEKADEFKKYADELLRLSTEEQDDRLFGYSYYYMMEYYAAKKDRVNTIYCAVEGIKYQNRSEEYYMAARSWFLLGEYTVFLGSSAKTVECYLTCIDYCEEYKFEKLHFMACNRVADIFRGIENYEKALEYYIKSIKYYKASKEEDTQEYVYLYCNMGYCYLELSDMKNALMCKEKTDRYIEEKECYPKFLVHTFFATLFNKLGNEKEMEVNLAIAKEALNNVKDFSKYWKDIESYINLLEKLDRKREVADLIDYYVTRCAIEDASFDIFEVVLKKGIKCAIATADNIRYISYSRRYFDMLDNENLKKAQRISNTEKVHMENALIQVREGKKSNRVLF